MRSAHGGAIHSSCRLEQRLGTTEPEAVGGEHGHAARCRPFLFFNVLTSDDVGRGLRVRGDPCCQPNWKGGTVASRQALCCAV